ncbi:MAG: nuclear transport factor 2 family protein [Actinobacteria bacterium]|nr:nuclear transport factor 2 family protein [Actinomycetota bacterium]
MSTITELQESAWEVEGRHDLDALLEYFHPDATFHQSNGDVYRGHAEIRAMTERFLREFPGCETEILSEYGDGETSAAIEFRATLTDPEGNVSALQGVQLVEVKDGKFKSVRGYEEQPVPVAEAA